jgi:hypothetical protein
LACGKRAAFAEHPMRRALGAGIRECLTTRLIGATSVALHCDTRPTARLLRRCCHRRKSQHTVKFAVARRNRHAARVRVGSGFGMSPFIFSNSLPLSHSRSELLSVAYRAALVKTRSKTGARNEVVVLSPFDPH